jgi:tetratricopeptide (TPR) repeat protein
LVALDRQGRPVVHADLDRMVSTSEWRRIPAGGADLARYTLTAPAGGLSGFRVRLLRQRRPEFSRWAGEPIQREPTVLAEVARSFPAAGPSATESGTRDAVRWRHYGMALTSVKAFPEALLSLQRALKLRPDDPETLLCLGGVYLDEGDLLAAREQFQRAQQGEPSRGRAWEGAVLRRMGQPDQAAALLEPLARRHPRDGRLRFELGYAYLDGLRNAEAAREFEAMLDVDPIDVSAHYNLMLCFQRMNRLTDARREETIYRLLRPETQRAQQSPASPEARPLHVHQLEPGP